MDCQNGTIPADVMVKIGSTVTIRDGALRQVWQIVNPEDSDPFANRISSECNLARALLGHRTGDEVQVRASGRSRPIVILEVEATIA
jgi:transcription elongation factor GreA